jgi:hypothetical protein
MKETKQRQKLLDQGRCPLSTDMKASKKFLVNSNPEKDQVLNRQKQYVHGIQRRHSVAQWLRHFATNRKVAGSIPDGVIGIFH